MKCLEEEEEVEEEEKEEGPVDLRCLLLDRRLSKDDTVNLVI